MTDEVKILVIDDEPTVIESFKMILKIKDYDVVAFQDGEEAVKQFKAGEYSLAFIDMRLPRIDGLEILKKLKEKDPLIEVIVVTAYATEESHANAINLGALEYLRKPFLMEEVYELVERGLRRRQRSMISRKKSNSAGPGEIH